MRCACARRGPRASALRSIGELNGGLSRFDSAIDDPCSILSLQAQRFNNDATVHANCMAQGVPAAGAQTAPTDQLSVVTAAMRI